MKIKLLLWIVVLLLIPLAYAVPSNTNLTLCLTNDDADVVTYNVGSNYTIDSTTKLNNGTLLGNSYKSNSSCPIGQCRNLRGREYDDGIQVVNNDDDFNFHNDSYTVCMFGVSDRIYPADNNGWFKVGDGLSTFGDMINLRIDAHYGIWTANWNCGDVGISDYISTETYTVGEWKLFCWQRNGTDGNYLINSTGNTMIRVNQITSWTDADCGGTTYPFWISGRTGSAGSEQWDGAIDQYAIWKRALTGAELDDYAQNKYDCDTLVSGSPPDTNPAAITLINLSGQIIYNLSSGIDNKLTGKAKTNDTTPTIRATTNESATCKILDRNVNSNYSYSTAVSNCTTTGGTEQICTLANANATLFIGLNNFSIGCKDSDNNENLTSTSGKFTINITDDVPPQVNLAKPDDNVFFVVGINNTNIKFNWTATDNLNRNFTCNGNVDGSQVYANSTYLNGTEGLFRSTQSTVGIHNWNVSCTDSFGNINSSQRDFTIKTLDINFTLNEPKNNTLIYNSINITFNFTINFTENIDKCFLYINNTINATNISSLTSNSKYILNSTNLTRGYAYSWSVGCNASGSTINSTDKFNLFVYPLPNISFSMPTPANNSVINNLSILINVSTQGKILNYTLEWNGTNETVTFNSTLNLLINKTGLADLTTYVYRVYVNDTNGNKNQTELRTVRTNLFSLEVGVTSGIGFYFRPTVERYQALYANQTITWTGNNTAIYLIKTSIGSNFTLYNNGTKANQGNNYTVNKSLGLLYIFNNSNIQWITNKINASYTYYTGTSYLRTNNISCFGQNASLGCLNVSTISASKDINFSLIWNITIDPVKIKIIEDFSIDAINWSVFMQRSSNTNNRSLVNHSILCFEIQSVNQTGLIEYRFNNTIELSYINQTISGANVSVKLNFTFNCSSPNAAWRILNATNISGFNNFNFSWKGDNSTNTFTINLIDAGGTKTASPTYSLANTQFNYSGFALGSIKNISIINISVVNVSGTNGLNNFQIDNLRLENSTSNQSQYIKTYASCTNSYANATLLIPNTMTNLCTIEKNIITKFIWLFQDILPAFKGISWSLNYNVTQIG